MSTGRLFLKGESQGSIEVEEEGDGKGLEEIPHKVVMEMKTGHESLTISNYNVHFLKKMCVIAGGC